VILSQGDKVHRLQPHQLPLRDISALPSVIFKEAPIKISLEPVFDESSAEDGTSLKQKERENLLNGMILGALHLCKEMLNEDQDDRIKDAHAHLEQALQIMSAQDLLLAQSRKQLDLKSPSKVFTSHTQKNLNELIEDGRVLLRMLPASMRQQLVDSLQTSSLPLPKIARHMCAIVLQCAFRSFRARKRYTKMRGNARKI